jgi:hypothetical protein
MSRRIETIDDAVTTPFSHLTRCLYPVDEAREQLGGISHTKFYDLVDRGEIALTKLGRRSPP